jgi:hypothetical protein
MAKVIAALVFYITVIGFNLWLVSLVIRALLKFLAA